MQTLAGLDWQKKKKKKGRQKSPSHPLSYIPLSFQLIHSTFMISQPSPTHAYPSLSSEFSCPSKMLFSPVTKEKNTQYCYCINPLPLHKTRKWSFVVVVGGGVRISKGGFGYLLEKYFFFNPKLTRAPCLPKFLFIFDVQSVLQLVSTSPTTPTTGHAFASGHTNFFFL